MRSSGVHPAKSQSTLPTYGDFFQLYSDRSRSRFKQEVSCADFFHRRLVLDRTFNIDDNDRRIQPRMANHAEISFYDRISCRYAATRCSKTNKGPAIHRYCFDADMDHNRCTIVGSNDKSMVCWKDSLNNAVSWRQDNPVRWFYRHAIPNSLFGKDLIGNSGYIYQSARNRRKYSLEHNLLIMG